MCSGIFKAINKHKECYKCQGRGNIKWGDHNWKIFELDYVRCARHSIS